MESHNLNQIPLGNPSSLIKDLAKYDTGFLFYFNF